MQNTVENSHKTAKLFKVVGDPSRLKIMQLLLREEGVCVSEVAERMNISVPATSQHMKLLELHELLSPVRSGQKICYAPNYSNPKTTIIIQAIKAMEEK